jgi:23S rRNA pseudouridine1911/1915/1917 synthase
VHPGAATHAPTLVHGLLHQYPELHGCIGHERPGIVHRLDRDTSGCILIARTEAVRLQLLQQFSRRCVRKVYYALVQGVPRVQPLRIERPIGRSDHDRKKMSATATHGREAITEARVLEHFNCGACALEVRIMTGRTHQIRVHLAYVGLPVLGDRVYGRAARDLSAAVQASRQMLHAQSLAFRHPITGAPIECAAPLPSDIHAVCARLRTLEQ